MQEVTNRTDTLPAPSRADATASVRHYRFSALSPYQRFAKRIFDLVIGFFLTLVALPVMALIAIAVKLDSPGPVFFTQQRVGEGGRLFAMYKFRSMIAGADAYRAEIVYHDPNGNVVHKHPDDPRVTRVGRILRRTSLDELPQLFNVLKGDMSLVGPRPELPWLVAQYANWQYARLTVPQGITGWWQINERANRPMHLHTEDDLYYIQNYSFSLDVRILLKTLPAVVRRTGAF